MRILLILSFLLSFTSLSSATTSGKEVTDFVIHHASNSHVWHPVHGVAIPLPKLLTVNGVDLSLSLHGLMLLISALLVLFLFGFLYKKNSSVAPKGLTNALESLVLFIRDEISIKYLGSSDGRKFAPFFLTFFTLILMVDLLGFIPFFATASSNINVAAGFSLITFSVMIFGGLIKNGPIGFIKIFLPPGIPKIMYLIIFPIEIMGIFIKPFALTMRLFANMLSGHIVIYSLVGLIMSFGWFGTPSVLIALFIYFLELLVAFIQAYIFTLLSAMFIGGMLHPEH